MNARLGRSCQGTENTYRHAPENKLLMRRITDPKLAMACASVGQRCASHGSSTYPRVCAICSSIALSDVAARGSDMVEQWQLHASRKVAPWVDHVDRGRWIKKLPLRERSQPAPLNDKRRPNGSKECEIFSDNVRSLRPEHCQYKRKPTCRGEDAVSSSVLTVLVSHLSRFEVRWIDRDHLPHDSASVSSRQSHRCG